MAEYFSAVQVQKLLKSEKPWYAHGIEIEPMERIIKYCREKGLEHVKFLVVDMTTGRVLDPKVYQLFMQSLDESDNLGMLEKFPPVVWP